REAVAVRGIGPMPSPTLVSAETSAAIVSGLDERGIAHQFGERVASIDPSTRVARLASGTDFVYDVFIGIPKHRVPDVVEASGLTAGGADGVEHVDPRNVRTALDAVYALRAIA